MTIPIALVTIGAMVWVLPALTEVILAARAALRPERFRTPDVERAPVLVFLVPAHNEERLIAPCVSSLTSMRSERSRWSVVVVADNCTDRTVTNAAALGATVLERHDLVARGKPAAIQWAIRQLANTEYDAVVIIDADTIVDPGFADALAGHQPLRSRVIQGYFSVLDPESAWLSRLGHLLARIRYEGQYRIKAKAGISCPLTGNGMCLGREVLERVGWPSESLTENWELYARCVSSGERVYYESGALLHSEEAESLEGGTVQRRRWQSGRWNVARQYAAAISRSSVGWIQKLDALVELTYPGPVVHAVIGAIGAMVSVALNAPLVAFLFALSVMPIVLWTIWAWATSVNRVAVAVSLLRLPLYAVWRVGIWLQGAVGRRNREWVRSPRATD